MKKTFEVELTVETAAQPTDQDPFGTYAAADKLQEAFDRLAPEFDITVGVVRVAEEAS